MFWVWNKGGSLDDKGPSISSGITTQPSAPNKWLHIRRKRAQMHYKEKRLLPRQSSMVHNAFL